MASWHQVIIITDSTAAATAAATARISTQPPEGPSSGSPSLFGPSTPCPQHPLPVRGGLHGVGVGGLVGMGAHASLSSEEGSDTDTETNDRLESDAFDSRVAACLSVCLSVSLSMRRNAAAGCCIVLQWDVWVLVLVLVAVRPSVCPSPLWLLLWFCGFAFLRPGVGVGAARRSLRDKISSACVRVHGSEDHGPQTIDHGLRTTDYGLRTKDHGPKGAYYPETRIQDPGSNSLKATQNADP